ncbi:MAG TPA: molybdopterin-dependent oxidoreductase [Pyrinomonadaceae bacterium]|nr:molybdopterin-dependent oxidoreductase [Pyrinomonadaceae bacterium]
MSEENKNLPDANDSGVLIEKVRELEAAKREEEAARLEQRRNTAKILGEKIHLSPPMSDEEARKTMGKYSRRSFLIGGGAAALGALSFWWLRQPEQAGLWDSIFTRTFKTNEQLSKIYYSPANLAPEFPKERIGQLRVNGGEGMSEGFDPLRWRLQVLGVYDERDHPQYKDDISYETAAAVTGATEAEKKEVDAKRAKDAAARGELTPPKDNGPTSEKIPGLLLTLEDIKALPRTEMITELKCIEGWSTITHWAGVRFSDFIEKFKPNVLLSSVSAKYLRGTGNKGDVSPVPYVSLITPDGGYYVGMDMQSMLHPQTLLCYEMNFAPLTIEHGAPLRLVTPMKYGIKNIKRIGRIEFTDKRPKDFWAESGYDWYSGH